MLAKLQGKLSFQFWQIFANFRPGKNLILTSTSKKSVLMGKKKWKILPNFKIYFFGNLKFFTVSSQ
jgi:hypothetical protein